MRILLVEDDPATAKFIAKGLTDDGHNVRIESDGRDGLYVALSEPFDAIVLDRMLPSLDGLSILRSLRAAHNTTPVLMLTALGDVEHRVEGLRSGADDYLTKPFAYSELIARVEGISRRPTNPQATEVTRLRVDDLELDLLKHEVTRSGERIILQPREFRLLEYLMRHAGKVVTRTMMLENVWDYHFDPQTNVIEVHMSRLRQKIDQGHGRPLLRTVRGSGYMLGS